MRWVRCTRLCPGLAHWVHTTSPTTVVLFFLQDYVRDQSSTLRSLGMKEFATLVFENCPELNQDPVSFVQPHAAAALWASQPAFSYCCSTVTRASAFCGTGCIACSSYCSWFVLTQGLCSSSCRMTLSRSWRLSGPSRRTCQSWAASCLIRTCSGCCWSKAGRTQPAGASLAARSTRMRQMLSVLFVRWVNPLTHPAASVLGQQCRGCRYHSNWPAFTTQYGWCSFDAGMGGSTAALSIWARS